MRFFKSPEINKENFLRFLPSKKFGFYLLIILCVPIFAFILFSRGGVVNRVVALINGTKTPKEIALLQAQAIKDTDEDGLDDWQEALWKTDFKNPDTDSDGTKDGDEVDANRNPLITSPNDSLSDTLKIVEQNIASPASDNITAELSKNILTKYMTTKKILGGNQVTAEVEEQITDSILAETDLKNEPTKLFTTSDFKITSDNSVTALRTYANALGAVAINYANQVDPLNDMIIAKDAIQSSDREKLALLSKSVFISSDAEGALLKILVPSSLEEKHLAILNTIYKIKENTNDTTLYFSDPMRAIIAIGKQGAEIKNLINSFVALNDSLESAGILFKNNEPGFFIQNNVNNLPK